MKEVQMLWSSEKRKKKNKKEKKNKRETNKDLSPSALPKPYHSPTRFRLLGSKPPSINYDF